MMANQFSNGKSIFILAIVACCFAVLWPNVLYPMIFGNYIYKSPENGCCDVLFENDVLMVNKISKLCEKVVESASPSVPHFHTSQSDQLISKCRHLILTHCDIDINNIWNNDLRNISRKNIDEFLLFNTSLCLRTHFQITDLIGLPRRTKGWELSGTMSKHMKQERPPHLRPDYMHPALREKGRAIVSTSTPPKKDRVPGQPMIGVRPPMGGAGHMTAPPKTGSSTMSIIMPIYTIGIILFFLYTIMRIMFRKFGDGCEEITPDPTFSSEIFKAYMKAEPEDGSKIGWEEKEAIVSAISGLVDEVNRQIDEVNSLNQPKALSTEKNAVKDKTPTESSAEESGPEKSDTESTPAEEKEEEEKKDGKSKVKVIGMDVTESSEKGYRYRPPTPKSRSASPSTVYLKGSLPDLSQVLVSDSHTEMLSNQENSVVLSGKVTLSLIGPTGLDDAELDVKSIETTAEIHGEANDQKSETT